MNRELEYYRLVERSIIKKYRKSIWNNFIKAVKTYKLVLEGDRIAVCISGGKDSMLLAKLMQQLQKISDVEFSLVFLVMDPGYSPQNRQKIIDNAKNLHIPITIFENKIFDIANSSGKSPCYLCARMRRGALYAKASELGCNKIALGHHLDDVIETTLLGMFYGSQLQAMMPKLHSTNFEGMELIRPLYCIKEKDIISWRDYNHLEFLRCACRFTENYEIQGEAEKTSKRFEVKQLISELEKTNKGIRDNIFTAINSVCIDTFPAYKKDGERHSFLENYEESERPDEK